MAFNFFWNPSELIRCARFGSRLLLVFFNVSPRLVVTLKILELPIKLYLAGDEILSALTKASGNGASIGGIKEVTANGWFAARPSGTEAVYKLYAESVQGKGHLQCLIDEAVLCLDGAEGECDQNDIE